MSEIIFYSSKGLLITKENPIFADRTLISSIKSENIVNRDYLLIAPLESENINAHTIVAFAILKGHNCQHQYTCLQYYYMQFIYLGWNEII